MQQVRRLSFDKSLDPNFDNDGPNPSVFKNSDMLALVRSPSGQITRREGRTR